MLHRPQRGYLDMVHSMTGFARQEINTEWGSLSWEIRTLNHRYLDTGIRLPDDLRLIEPQVRERVAACLSRGKVECSLRFRPQQAQPSLSINQGLAAHLIELSSELKSMLGDESAMRSIDLMRWPGVIEEGEADLQPLREAALELLDHTLGELIESRGREGQRLGKLIEQRCQTIDQIVNEVTPALPEIRHALRERIQKRLQDAVESYDESRLEQEMVLLFSKLDVDEELDRLTMHVQEIREILQRDEPVGRRLDFLMQELNREANTLGSKSAALQTTRSSVDLKVVIEQMREQIQNIE